MLSCTVPFPLMLVVEEYCLNRLDAGLRCEDEDAAGPSAFFFHFVEKITFIIAKGKGNVYDCEL